MGKKKSAEMERQKKDFIEGAVKNGITKEYPKKGRRDASYRGNSVAPSRIFKMGDSHTGCHSILHKAHKKNAHLP